MKNKIFYKKLDLLSSLFVYVSKMSDKYSQSYVKNKKNECPESNPVYTSVKQNDRKSEKMRSSLNDFF